MEDAIRQIIYELYDCVYTGKLRVKPLDPVGYEMTMELQSDERPLHLAAQLEKEDFLNFIREELRKSHFNSDHFYTGYKYDLPPINPCNGR